MFTKQEEQETLHQLILPSDLFKLEYHLANVTDWPVPSDEDF